MNRHLSLALVIVITIAGFCTSVFGQSIWKEAKTFTWSNATGAEQYERLLWKAVQSKDWLAVESHIASNFVYMDAAGTKDKSQLVADLKAKGAPEGEIAEANVTAQGIDAIVTYSMGKNRIMSVWQQQKKGWSLVAMSVTSK